MLKIMFYIHLLPTNIYIWQYMCKINKNISIFQTDTDLFDKNHISEYLI